MASLLNLNYPPEMLVLIGLAFLGARTIKGILGMGLPAILMVSLTLIMPPLEAIPLIFLPMLFINVVQFFRGPHPQKTAREYSVFAIAAFVVIIVVGLNLKRFPEEMLLASIGVAMILFAIPSLYGWRYHIGPSRLWQLMAGVCTGIIGGLSSIWSPPVVMYLMGRNINKDEFVGVVGFLFMVGSLGLGIALGTIKLLEASLFVPSMVGLGIALIGFRLGERIRARIDRDRFTKIIMLAFLLMGLRLVLISTS